MTLLLHLDYHVTKIVFDQNNRVRATLCVTAASSHFKPQNHLIQIIVI